MDAVILVFSIFIGVGLYLAPAIVAQTRNIKHVAIIFSINVVLGWTVIAWVAALIWAVREPPGSGDWASPCAVQPDVWTFDPQSLSDAPAIDKADDWIFGPHRFLESSRNR